jgi:hypothetical protein
MTRYAWRSNYWDGKRKAFALATAMSGLMVIVLFLGVMSYIYGALYRSSYKIHNLNILAVDFDGGYIGESVFAAYSELEGKTFPTLQSHNVAEYSTAQEVQDAVCRGDYWGAIYSHSGASSRLSAALSGGLAARDYEANNTITYIHNGARYPSAQLGDIAGTLATLAGAASSAFFALNGTQALQSLNMSDAAATEALFSPIFATSVNLAVLNQGDRVLYNTISIVLPVIQQFFFLMALNGIANSFGIYGYLDASRVCISRLIVSVLYTFLASLTVTGYI